MSISREDLADVLEINEECVKCENCAMSEKFVNDAYICHSFGEDMVSHDDFCTFFEKRGIENVSK